MTSEARLIDAPSVPPLDLAPHDCFACGTLNEHGLGLVLHVERQRAWADVELAQRFQGWDDMAHGGIICTILDEVMAWALVAQDNWGVTARMAVAFRRPVRIGHPIRAEGWTTRTRRRLTDTAASIVDRNDGTVLATATGVYVAADEERKEEVRARYGLDHDGGSR